MKQPTRATDLRVARRDWRLSHCPLMASRIPTFSFTGILVSVRQSPFGMGGGKARASINKENHLRSCIRKRLVWSPLLLCLILSSCGGSSPGSTSTTEAQSADAQPASSSQILPPPPQPPPADSAPSENLRFRRDRPPKYPVQAVRERMEGKVILKVLVGLEGEPEEISLEKSCGYEALDRAAIAAVKTWTFNAGIKNGVAIRGYVLVPIEFNVGQ
jgi:TonB family protein